MSAIPAGLPNPAYVAAAAFLVSMAVYFIVLYPTGPRRPKSWGFTMLNIAFMLTLLLVAYLAEVAKNTDSISLAVFAIYLFAASIGVFIAAFIMLVIEIFRWLRAPTLS